MACPSRPNRMQTLGWETGRPGSFAATALEGCRRRLPWSRALSEHSSGAEAHKRFYEKVMKVKADVPALLRSFSDVSHRHPMVTCGAVKGAAEGRRSA